MEEAVLKQFEVLWAEIGRRSNIQQALIASTAAITGSLGGLVATEKLDEGLLLALAVVAPTFGLLWLDHAQSIEGISDFISEKWQPDVNWERDRKKNGRLGLLIFIPAVMIVFLGPAVAGLVASAGDVSWAAWSCAAGLSVAFAIGGTRFGWTLWKSHGSTEDGKPRLA